MRTFARTLLTASSTLALLVQAHAFERVLPSPRIKENGDLRFSDDLTLGNFANGQLTLSPIVKLPPISAGGLDPQAVTSIQVSPKFCPPAQLNGTTPNDACVQAAINYACAVAYSPAGKVAGELVFSRADYYIKNGISIPKACGGLFLVGQGPSASGGTRVISDNNCTAPIINFYPDAAQNYVYGGGVRSLHLFNNKPIGGGFDGTSSCLKPLIQANYGRDMHFEHISVLSPSVFMKLVGGHNFVIDDITGDQALPNSPGVFEFMGYGATATGSAQQLTRQDGINLGNVLMFAAQPGPGQQYPQGIWWHGLSQSLRTHKTAFQNFSTALRIDCTNPTVDPSLRATVIEACPGLGVFTNFETECAGANCIDMTDTTGNRFLDLYAACFGRTNTANPSTSGCNNAVKVRNTQFSYTGQMTFNGGQISGAQASGIDYEGFQLTVTGGTKLYGNNAANVGGADITLETPPSGKKGGSHVIAGNIFCEGPAGNSAGETALNLLSGNDYVVFTPNVLKGCGAGVFAPGGNGAHSIVSPNAGP